MAIINPVRAFIIRGSVLQKDQSEPLCSAFIARSKKPWASEWIPQGMPCVTYAHPRGREASRGGYCDGLRIAADSEMATSVSTSRAN